MDIAHIGFEILRNKPRETHTGLPGVRLNGGGLSTCPEDGVTEGGLFHGRKIANHPLRPADAAHLPLTGGGQNCGGRCEN